MTMKHPFGYDEDEEAMPSGNISRGKTIPNLCSAPLQDGSIISNLALEKPYPWLAHIDEVCQNICQTLRKKEVHYKGSWQKRGGPGAFMMLARKWDRVEAISSEFGYDIFKAMQQNRGDIKDDVDDLIGYLVLVRAEMNRRLEEEEATHG